MGKIICSLIEKKENIICISPFFYYLCLGETIYKKRNNMKVNVNHPSFISFLEAISNNILSAIKLEDYFGLTAEKKITVSFTVLNLIKNSAKVKANLSDAELKSFIIVLCKKNEENENYEFAAVLNDVIKNYEVISNLSTSMSKKPFKQEKTNSDLTPQQ
jgi:hypothetical protein